MTPDPRVPLNKVLSRNPVKEGNNVASIIRIDLGELVTVAHHTRLGGRGRGDAIPRLRRRAPDDSDARVRAGLQAAALAPANARVPLDKVLGRDRAVEEGNDVARVARVDHDELVAVADDARVRGHGCRDAVAALRRRRLSRCAPDDANTGPLREARERGLALEKAMDQENQRNGITYCSGPETGAGALGGGIPLGELGEGDGVELQNGRAVLVVLYPVKLVAVADHAGLGGLGCVNAVCGACGRRLKSCGETSCAARRRLGYPAARRRRLGCPTARC